MCLCLFDYLLNRRLCKIQCSGGITIFTRFTINTNEVIIGSLRVVDMNGKQITKRAVELLPGNHEFDLTLSTGVYMFILEYNESQEMQRVLIQ